jgi:hypothetical protein
MLIGSGTGLTSALSVLKEVIERRNPKYVRNPPFAHPDVEVYSIVGVLVFRGH